MALDNTVALSVAYFFVYCCCIGFHPGSNALKINEPTLTDAREPLI